MDIYIEREIYVYSIHMVSLMCMSDAPRRESARRPTRPNTN